MRSRLKAVGLRIGAPVFTAAGLVLSIEPMLGKLLLPALGGSPATWAACLWAFQVLLLVGYGYAYVGSRYLRVREQAVLHLLLLLVSVAVLMSTRVGAQLTLGRLPPLLEVPRLVLLRVGLPYVLLSSTAPLLSRWSRTLGRSGRAIYAISNAGAFLGLLSYPLLLERFVALPAQLALWSAGFVLFALSLLPACVATIIRPPLRPRPVERVSQPPRRKLYCGVCALLPSALLLAVTHHVTVDVAATPALWVVPLALYLLSFVIAFSRRGRWVRLSALAMWLVGCAGVSLDAFWQGAGSLWVQLVTAMLALFGAALWCHAELAREHPPSGDDSGFFLIVATGGALGGALVGLCAPLLLKDFYELELCAMAMFMLLLLRVGRESRPFRLLVYLGAGVCLPLVMAESFLRQAATGRDGRVLERRRGFSGTLKVVQTKVGRVLEHGRIQHGLQLAEPSERHTPTMYFSRETAVGRVLAGVTERPRRLGVVGLGVGTLAAYGRPGDSLRFYELDPNVVELSQRDFSFLRDSQANVSIAVGDGRISLAHEAPRAFDVLVLDAFSSDSVPVHLLTREAFEIYRRQLAPDGLLLANVSNRHLDLERVVRGSARAVGLESRSVETQSRAATHTSHVVWAVMATTEARLQQALGELRSSEPLTEPVTWTDGRASLLSVLR